jgi:tRNA-2-methylthio-N6-dimethylallyladenosine synthase
MLKQMNRGYTVAEYDEFLHRARAILHQPEIGRPLMISGDMIVGFCSETEEDHEASMRLIERANYKSAFIFKYSPRPGTVAYDKMPDDIPDEVKRRRNNAMLALQSSVSERVMAQLTGMTFDAMVEGVSFQQAKREKRAAASGGGGVSLTIGGRDPGAAAVVEETPLRDTTQLSARTDGDAIVHFDCPHGRSAADLVGRIVKVKVTASDAISLSGELV